MYWRILRKSLLRKEGRLTVAWLSMFITAALATLLWSLSADVGAKMSREVKAAGPNLVIAPRMASGLMTMPKKQEDQLLSELRQHGIDVVAATILGVGRIGEQNLIVAGMDLLPARRLFPYWKVDGQWPARRDAVLVGAELANLLSISLGDTLALAGETEDGAATGPMAVAVAGILHTGASEEWELIGDRLTIQSLLGRTGEVSVLQVRLNQRGEEIVRLAKALEDRFPQIDASPVLKIATTEATLYRTLRFTLALVTVLSVFLTLLALATGLAGVVFQRQREIAAMKVLGARSSRVWALLLGEVASVSAISALAGIGIGLLAAQATERFVFGSGISLRWEVLPGVFVAVVVTACLAAVPPFRKAVGVAPSVALRGE